MNAKKLSISIFLIIFIIFGAVSAITYDKSEGVNIICYEGSFAEEYAKEHDLNYVNISDSDAHIGVISLENFDYNIENGVGEIMAYNGESEKIAIPTDIEGTRITKVDEKAFENAKNIKTIYLPKSVETFEPKTLEGVTVHLYEDTELYKTLAEDKELGFELETIIDSYYVNFYSSNIPFAYDNISDKTIDITKYNAELSIVVVPESIDGKIVTAISFDALEEGVRTILIPKSVTNINTDLYGDRYDKDFLIGISMAFVGMMISILFVLTLKVKTKEKLFLRVPQIRAAYSLTIWSTVLALLFLFANATSDGFIYTLYIIVLGVSWLTIFKAKTATVLVEGVDEKIEKQIKFIKALTADAEHLVNCCKDETLKEEAEKVYEAIRYSDPMSNEALFVIEEQIKSQFTYFTQVIEAEDEQLAKNVAEALLNLIDSRNKKCKSLK